MKKLLNPWTQGIKKYIRQTTHHLSVFLLLGVFSNLHGDESDLDPHRHPTGLLPLSEEQIQKVKSTWPELLGVRPNKYGIARIEAYMLEQGLSINGLESSSYGIEEFITNQNSDAVNVATHQNRMAAISLPPSVDNSKLACFPPIGDQKQLGACVGWASTYYHATHEYGLINGLNNKTNPQGIRSPKWTYNMLNFGQDAGAYPMDAYDLLSVNGATSFSSFPYNTNYREWDLNPDDWISAISYRLTPAQFFTITSPGDIDVLKQLLNNGHVATFVTYAYSWQMTKVKADPAQASNPYAGQSAISWMNGMSGGHHVTIVGYDDNIWVDINNNGQVDPGEKGAFLMANSWGEGWGNKGFMWISYDAFYTMTTVPNGPSINRQPIAQMLYSTTAKSANYTPRAVAKFSVSQAVRNQLKMSVGVSSTNTATPTKKIDSVALSTDGGAFAFNGQASQLQTATFALDITDLLPAMDMAQKYYLITQDVASGNPTTLNSYSIVDMINKKEVAYQGTPLNADQSVIQPGIVFQFSNDNSDKTPPTVAVTSPTNNSTVSGNINITVNAQDNIGVARVEFYIDSMLLNTDLSAPFVFPLDTKKFANGQHMLAAVAYDAAGNSARNTVLVNVQNSSVDNVPPTVQITSPGDGSNVSGIVNFTATATDNIGVQKIEFYVDSSLQNTASTAPYGALVDTSVFSNGQHNFKAVAYDTSNNTSQQVISVNVQNQGTDNPPTVAITYPSSGTYLGGTIFVTVNATDNSQVSRVELYVDCKMWAVDSSAPYSFRVDTVQLSRGWHVLTAKAYDDSGNSTQSSAVVINIQN